MLRAVLDLLYPPACPGCGAPAPDAAFCAPCYAAIDWIVGACARCALPAHSDPCGPWVFDSAAAAALYDGAAREALLRFKIGGERRSARAFAAAMMAQLPEGALTYVPATRRSIAERGFNTADVIARVLGRATGRPVVPLLRKARETTDQAGLNRARRAQNLVTAIEPARGAPPTVVLIDDILTTGATADACAGALRRAGTRVVHVRTFARTP